MDIKVAYNIWAAQYDTNKNKTRDLEGIALRSILSDKHFDYCLEIGCGTGKNTEWLMAQFEKVLAIDISDEMLARAKDKIQSPHVDFIQADINDEWSFAKDTQFDIAICSLVLEHIENLDPVFEKLSSVVKSNGYVYIGELHPFKQYLGTKASFETENGLQTVTCYNHNISDFTKSAKKYGFELELLEEFFDNNDRTSIPRIMTLLFKKDT